MANPIKGEVALEIGGQRYVLMLGTYALAAMERRLGMSWIKIFERAGHGDWGIDQTLAVFHAGLLKHHRSMTEEQAADLMDAAGLEYVNKAIVDALILMQPQIVQGGGEGQGNPLVNGADGMSSSSIGSP